MKDKKETSLKLNKREMDVITIALKNHADNVQKCMNMTAVSNHHLTKESFINMLYNIESIQNKIKKEGM